MSRVRSVGARLVKGATARLAGARPTAGGPAGPRVDAAEVLKALDEGRVVPEVEAAVRDRVAAADAALGSSGPAAAVAPLTSACQLLFHRSLHFDGLTSPLAADPEGFLAPLRGSKAWARATAARPRRTPAGGSERAPGPHRLLLVTYKNWQFLAPIAEHMEARDDVEVRRLDLADAPPKSLPLSVQQQLRLRLTGGDDPRSTAWGEWLAPHLAWADTVFVDWLQRGAVVATALDPGRARVVVRLHSFEAFTAFSHLVDYGRVDDVVVVGAHLGRLLHRAVPASNGPRLHLVPNAADLGRFARPKPTDARFTLALVGWGVVAKDALWALQVLARLRAQDPRYRLLLVGRDLENPEAPSGQQAYAARFAARAAQADVAGAVEKVPFTPDVPGVLERAGVVLSSSVRESFHLGLVEGAASGAVPVVRDWPLFAAVGGPHGLFPDEWIVSTAEAAADRVLRVTAEEASWRAEGDAARQWVMQRYDGSVTWPQYDRLLLSDAAADPA